MNSIIITTIQSFQLFFILLQLIVGCTLIVKMKKTKLYNLIPLIIYFLLNSLLLLPLPYLFFQIIAHFPSISLIFFTKYTFYKEKKSSYMLIIGIVSVLKLLDFTIKLYFPFSFPMKYGISTDMHVFLYYLYLISMAGINLLSHGFLAHSTLSYYNKIKNQSIAPWIKKRYIIIGISSSFLSLNGIAMLFMPWSTKGFEDPQGFLVGIFILVMTAIFSIGSVMGWMMPQKFKNYFDRNYEPTIEDEKLSEIDLIEKIKKQLTDRGFHGNN